MDTLAPQLFTTIAASPSSSSSSSSLLTMPSRTIYQQQLNVLPSHAIWNNQVVEHFRSQQGIYAVCHADSTRCDAATQFTEKDCTANGAAGRIRACQLLAEMAFKLGRTPKYGA
ncbi:hypothetical protein SYNPS1DRAFT_32181 [Syncephalis pseudoplumigaleata]|uniref:Uncharacterized protein n=1 Tax=Syncephalis pseudoplumigaleata TaxID=1712513 RepID=A0A4P9YR89_9FUNG|nr:hypothetical protein SYNPS1DRAFT_32181 [Syncephalis pseudoplumigaleata]|eukprot:RKP22244.1 hypothetical protein SYNPS1DRAFT_32181 [Syncephalis pseudoplumigaleata]